MASHDSATVGVRRGNHLRFNGPQQSPTYDCLGSSAGTATFHPHPRSQCRRPAGPQRQLLDPGLADNILRTGAMFGLAVHGLPARPATTTWSWAGSPLPTGVLPVDASVLAIRGQTFTDGAFQSSFGRKRAIRNLEQRQTISHHASFVDPTDHVAVPRFASKPGARFAARHQHLGIGGRCIDGIMAFGDQLAGRNATRIGQLWIATFELPWLHQASVAFARVHRAPSWCFSPRCSPPHKAFLDRHFPADRLVFAGANRCLPQNRRGFLTARAFAKQPEALGKPHRFERLVPVELAERIGVGPFTDGRLSTRGRRGFRARVEWYYGLSSRTHGAARHGRVRRNAVIKHARARTLARGQSQAKEEQRTLVLGGSPHTP